MKKCFLTFITIIIMFFFNNVAKSDYEKIFYDFNIESINGELIDFKESIVVRLPREYRGKRLGHLWSISWVADNINLD